MSLNKFLVKAKISTYANEYKSNRKVLEDGAKEFIFEDANLKYRDRYYGFNPFIGEEIVWKDNRIVWSMNYFGKIISDTVSAKQVYNFLKTCLRQIEEDKPFRGPNYFKRGNFEYVNKSRGNIAFFSGSEKISFNGQEIYVLKYHGGVM